MTDGLKPRARAYIIVSNCSIQGVTIKRITGNLCLVLFDKGGGIQIGRHRLFLNKDEAENYLTGLKMKKCKMHSAAFRFGNC